MPIDDYKFIYYNNKVCRSIYMHMGHAKQNLSITELLLHNNCQMRYLCIFLKNKTSQLSAQYMQITLKQLATFSY